MFGKIPWNKGLTKETDERVLKYSLVLKGRPGNKSPKSAAAHINMSIAQRKRAKEHPETFTGRNTDNNILITNDSTLDSYYIGPFEPLPEGYRYGGKRGTKHDMTNYWNNPEAQAVRSKNSSGEHNGMYKKGYLISYGNNGHATKRYFYKDLIFESMKELLEYLNKDEKVITKSAIMIFTKGEATKRLFKMYGDILKDLTWEYK